MNKKRTYEILEKATPGDIQSKIFDIFIMSMITLNVISVVLETVQQISNIAGTYFKYFEIFSVIVFTIEYILRVWASTINPLYSKRIWGRIKFALSP